MTKNILVIEDEPGIGMAIKDELEFEGFAVELAQDGLAGVEAIVRSSPQLIVLDLMLPGKNGFQVCEEIRERGLNIPIIMLTARSQETDKVRGLELGADDYVTKPFSLAELVARIRAVLRRYEDDSHRDIYRIGQLTLDLTRQRRFERRNARPAHRQEVSNPRAPDEEARRRGYPRRISQYGLG